MFTGIVEELGPIITLSKDAESLRMGVQSTFLDVEIGESIAVNGVCLTATETNGKGELHFFVGYETLAKSQLGKLSLQSVVNLERALTLQKRLSGHFLQGHVDGVAILSSVRDHSNAYELEFKISQHLSRYCVEKGSISLNGVSLTVFGTQALDDDHSTFRVMIIPHTWKQTNLSRLQVGEGVNVEVDVLAKYVEQLCRNPN